MLFSPDGTRLYVLCQESDEVRVLDAKTYAPIKNIGVGHGAARIFAFAEGQSAVCRELVGRHDLGDRHEARWRLSATWPVGAEPSSVVEDRAGKHLFVANRISNDVAVLDAQTGAEEKRLAAGRGASYITPRPMEAGSM